MNENSFPLADINAYMNVRNEVEEAYSWLSEKYPVITRYLEAKEDAVTSIMNPGVVK
jgi:hypothetical protein